MVVLSGMIYVFAIVAVSVILIYYMFKVATRQRELEEKELMKYFNQK